MCFEGLKKTMKDLSQDSMGPAEIWTGTSRTLVRRINTNLMGNLQNLKQKSINMYNSFTAHKINSTPANEWEYYNKKKMLPTIKNWLGNYKLIIIQLNKTFLLVYIVHMLKGLLCHQISDLQHSKAHFTWI